ncbi:MAG: HigA family addiction module antitoxin [Cyanobacteria bacterium J06598_3]
MTRIPTHRAPTHPGEMLLEEFLIPMEITQRALAESLQVPYQRINEIINGRRGITPSTALRLAKYFKMSADFWMNLQLRLDLYHAQQAEADTLDAIQPRQLA